MADEIARIGDGGCLESLPNGTVGQVLGIGAGGTPVWVNASDDQVATEVPFTPYSTLAATTVQGAIQEIVDEFCDMIGGCSVDALNDVDLSAGADIWEPLIFDGTNFIPIRPSKIVSNVGSVPPIAVIADTGQQPLWNASGYDVSAETNDIIPATAAGGERVWYIRRKGANYIGHLAQSIPSATTTNIVYQTPVQVDGGITYNAGTGEFTVPVTGWVYMVASVHFANAAGVATPANSAADYFINLTISGSVVTRVNHYPNQVAGNAIHVAGIRYITAGSTISVNIFHTAPDALTLINDPFTMVGLAYIGG